MFKKRLSISQLLQIKLICSLCNHIHKGNFPICDDCTNLLTPLTTPCKYCGLPLENSTYRICGLCTKDKPNFDKVIANFLYTPLLRSLVHEYKYKGGIYLKNYLTHLMLKGTEPISPRAIIVPIPMHKKRLQKRGYNHAEILAFNIAKILKVKYSSKIAIKTQNTRPQAELDARSRKANLKGSFQVSDASKQHIILIDDVITTGSTANTLAYEFKNKGAYKVDVWCIGRTSASSEL